MAFEGYLRRKEKREMAKTVAPSTAEAEQAPSIPEILNEHGEEWGDFLGSQSDPALRETFARFKTDAGTADDLKVLLKQRDKFLEQKKTVETLLESFDHYLDDFTERSDKFTELAGAIGKEDLHQLVRDGLFKLAFAEPKEFAKVNRACRKLEEFEENVEKPLDAQIQAFCDTHKLTAEEFDTAMANDDIYEREQAVRLLMRHKMGFWKRLADDFDSSSTGTRLTAMQMSADKGLHDKILADRNAIIEKAGSSIAVLLEKHDFMRTAMLRVARGEEPQLTNPEKLTFDEMKTEIHDKEVSDSWKTFLTDNGVDDFSAKDPSYQDVLRGRFKKDFAKKKAAGKSGFWKSVLGFMFSIKIKDSELN